MSWISCAAPASSVDAAIQWGPFDLRSRDPFRVDLDRAPWVAWGGDPSNLEFDGRLAHSNWIERTPGFDSRSEWQVIDDVPPAQSREPPDGPG